MVNMGELFAHSRISNVTMDRVPVDTKELVYVLETGDLLFARQSLVLEGAGQCSIFVENYEPTVFESHIIRCRLDKSVADPDFYYYFFRSRAGRATIEQIVEQGAGASGIRGSDLADVSVPVPTLTFQRSVAGILRSIDDRIGLLRQTTATLEAIAQALFKSWFVDFDPVHAKAEDREPEAMDAATAALFPSEFEESELGPIPKGWCAGRLGDVSSNIRDQARPGKINPDTPYFGLEHMPRKSIALVDHGTADGLGSGKFWFEESDILFGKLRPYFHKVGLAPFKGICSTDILVLRPLRAAFHAFLLMHASSDALIDYATRLSNGAKMPRSSWKDIANYPICVPPDSTVQAFNETVDPTLRRIKANVEAASTLAKVRDTLLPRLISGKLRLPEATEAANAVLA